LRIRLPDRYRDRRDRQQSLREAQTAYPPGWAPTLVLQGRLFAGEVIAEAGLSAQPKAAKPMPR
jgi:hypothetical protein